MSRKKWFIIIGVVLIIAILVIVNLRKGKGGEIPVQVGKVTRGDITQIVSASGKIQPELEVKISANISAEIIGLYVKEGDQVTKGQLLVELDRTKYSAAVDRARSNKKSREASLQKARSEYKRALDLYKQNLTSQAELENAEANLKLAESQLEQAEADLKQAEDDLTKTKLYSPLTGTVTVLNKEVGEIALGSMFQADVIMIVADLSRMEVISEVDENDVVLVSIGDTASIEVDAIPDTTFRGVVSEIAHSGTIRGRGTQEELTNFEVTVAVIDKVDKLRPGMTATVDIATEKHRNVLHIPIQAVTVRTPEEIASTPGTEKATTRKVESPSASVSTDDKKETTEANAAKKSSVEVVFVVKDGIASIVPVKTAISNDTNIEIVSGLEEGQQVVIGSYRALSKMLKNGSKVKITEKPMPKSEPKE
jgi:HlyD family secretion protein